jgi:peptidoglycan/xylan/chitin deacetylase (PgdA/CDA1 family)
LEKYEVPACFFITAIRSEGKDCLWNDVLSIAGITGPQKLVFNKEEYTKARGKYWSASGRLLNDVLRYESLKARQQVIDHLTMFTGFKEKVHQNYWLQLTADQIRQLAKSKWVTIGSHSSWHNDLAKSLTDDLKADLKKSKSFLENCTGQEVRALAFPYGSYTRNVIEEAKATGYTQLLATEFLYPEDKYDPALKERLTINPFISSIHQVHANISGHY